MARTGRRPGASGTRDAILASARRRFAEDGYRGATIRAIAGDAGVDPALVHHYFGTKQELFGTVLDLPASPGDLVDRLAAAEAHEVGRRVIETFLEVWDEPTRRERMKILLRTAMVDETAARMIRGFVVESLLAPVAARLGAGDAPLRATLVASQLVGFAFVRYLLELEPLASASHEQVVAAYAPTLQRYLTGPLDGAGSS